MPPDDARPPFLVLSHHRSGSNFLCDLLQAHPQVECLNEPMCMHTRYFRDVDLARWPRSEYDAHWLHPSLAPHEGLRAYLTDLRELLHGSCGARVIGFKETGLFGKLGWLSAYLPGLRILFLKRDPRAIVASVLRSGLMEFWRYRERVPAAFAELWPLYRRRAEGGELGAAELAAMSVAVRHELARRELGPFEHRVVELEGLRRGPESALEHMTRFLGLQPHAQQLAFLARRSATSRGGAFSSFRSRGDVELAWQQRLSARQIEIVDTVLEASVGCHREQLS